MNNFCVQSIKVPEVLRADHGVLHAAALLATADACRAAGYILAQAQEQADKLRAAARRDAQQAVRREQAEVARRATFLLQGLQQAQREMLARVDGLAVELAQETFDRLVLELTPRERTAAMLRRIVQEAPNKLVASVLFVHPEDVGDVGRVFDVAGNGDMSRSGWEVRSDPALKQGTCRLEATSGEWRAEFELAVAALRSALGVAAEVFAPPLAGIGTPGAESVVGAIVESAAPASEDDVINLEDLAGNEDDAVATHRSHQ